MALVVPYSASRADDPTITRASPPVEVLRIEGVTLAYPRWMPAGDRIVFQGDQSGRWQIYAAVVDGTGIARLTSGNAASYYPDPSPDGRHIAFVSDRTGNEDIYIMDADGSDVRNITDHPARDIHPYWTPDGLHIVFNSTRDDPEGFLPHVYEIAVDGGAIRQLTSGDDYETCARASPDGAQIVYLQTFVGNDQHDDVCLRDRDGDDLRNLTGDTHRDGWPAWSPDGESIVFASMRSGTFRLYTMRRDGTGVRQLTAPEAPIADVRPVYSPDGRQVLFNRVLGDDTVAIMRLPLQP
jgi:TolB protein